ESGSGVRACALGELHVARVPQVERHVRGRLVAMLHVRLEAAQDDFLEPWGHLRVSRARRYGQSPQAIAHADERRGMAEGRLARGELVEDRPQRVDVAARIAAAVAQLLWRHVGGGS